MNLDEEMRKLRESSTGELPAAQPRLDVDAVMARVRQEVARRKQARSATPMTAAVASDAGVAVPAIGIPALPRWSPAVPRLPYRSQYTLAELLAFADRDFVDQCYRILLRRSPDPGGLDHYLGRLRRGQLSKIEVLGEIRFSPEGMRHQVHVDGLLLPYTLHRWQRKPVLGPLLRWAHGLWRLGESSQRQQSLDVAHARELQEAGHLLNQAFDQIDTAWQALQLRQQQLEQQQEQRSHELAEANRKQGEALQARLDTAETGLQARLDAAESGLQARLDAAEAGLRTELAAIRTDLSRLAPLDALARVRDHTEANRKQGEALQARLDTAETGLQARLDAAETGLRTELAALRQALAPVTARVATTEQTSQRLEQELLRQVKRLEATHAAIRTELSRFAPLDALARVRDHTEANRKQGQALQARLDAAENGLRARLDAAETELRTERTVLARALNEAVEPLRHQQVATAAFERRMLEDAERLERRLAALDAGMPPLLQRLDHEAARIDGLDARIRPVEEALTAASEERLARVESLDALYAAFEDRFRGSRELIHSRIRPYLEWVREAGAGSREAPVLDVGCGRGEWLEMLRDAEMHGRGIDLNRLFVDACRGRGLEVDHADALQALRAMPEASVGALTSMHLVEHLPFETVIALLDEAKRVLRPGGLLVLETPNPENLLVGACTFYMDPTHRNPIPPEALRWIVEARGFHAVRIERLSVGRDLARMVPIPGEVPGAETINALSGHFTAAPDYAVLGRRP